MAIAWDNTTNDPDSVGRASASFSHTVTGANPTLVVFCYMLKASNPAATVTAITYNGVALTYRTSVNRNYGTTRNLTCEVWTLDNPATGANTVAVTYSATLTCDVVSAISYTGANNGVGSTDTSNASSATMSCDYSSTLSTSLNIFGGCMTGGDSDPFAPLGSETERVDGATGTDVNTDIGVTANELAATGGADTLGATPAVTDNWSACMIELLEAAGAGAVVGRGLLDSQLLNSGVRLV